MRIDRAGIAKEIVAPDAREDLLAIEHAAGMGGEQIQQLHLARRTGHALAGQADAIALGLDLQRAIFERSELFLVRRAVILVGAPQHSLDAGDDLARGERLDDIVVRAHLQAQNAVDLLTARGEHDDGQRALAPHALADLHAGHTRHHLIQQHEVIMIPMGHLQRALAVIGRIVLEFLVIQIQGKRLMDDGIVVADEYFRMLIHTSITSIIHYNRAKWRDCERMMEI